jgi:hypothetical protein
MTHDDKSLPNCSFSDDTTTRDTEAGSVVFTAMQNGALHEYEVAAATLFEYFGATSRNPAPAIARLPPRAHAPRAPAA